MIHLKEPGGGEVVRLPPLRAPVVEQLEAWVRSGRRSGELRVLEGSPLEGVARFEEGELKEASFCWLTGATALAEMVAIEGDELVFVARESQPPPTAPRRVLVIEDDDATRALLKRLLTRHGWQVVEARDGVEGLHLVARQSFDLLITDLEMPRLDGWGVLRRLRDEPRTRALAVVVFSAHDEELLALEAARAGAQAWVRKTGHHRELLDVAARAVEPRQALKLELRAARDVCVELSSLGLAGTLELLAEFDVRGWLSLPGRARFTLADGRLVALETSSGEDAGVDLVARLLEAPGEACFHFGAVSPVDDAPWIFDVVQQAQQTLMRAEQVRARARLQTPHRWRVEPDLAHLHLRLASPAGSAVLERVRHRACPLDELSRLTGLELPEVTNAMKELFLRGVLVEG